MTQTRGQGIPQKGCNKGTRLYIGMTLEKFDEYTAMTSNQQSPERESLPTAPDLEANRPLLSRTSTLHDSHNGDKVPIILSDKDSQRRRRWFWSDWKCRFDARVVSDSILGLSDGLTVPFALTAGLTAFGDTRVVILGGLAELVAGAISMGLGGYVGAKSEAYV